MLPRAALRAAALRSASSKPIPRTLPSAWSRSYAHFNKPTTPPRKPSAGSSGNNTTYQPPSKLSSQRPTAFIRHNRNAQDEAGQLDTEGLFEANTKETGEFNAQAAPEKNTAPKSQPGPAVTQSAPSNDQNPRDRSQVQEEFEGPKTAEANTAPFSQLKQAPDHASREAEIADEPQAHKGPLPDLRHGIPSTFAEEFGRFEKRGRPSEVDRDTSKLEEEIEHAKEQDRREQTQDTEAGAAGGRGGGELPKSAYETSTDRRRNKVMNWFYLAVALFGGSGAVFLGRNWDTDEEAKRHADIPSGWGVGVFWERIKARINDSLGYYTEPTFPELLPKVEPEPPYTLVLSLEDLMVHSEWSRQHGYRTAKRPGLDYFLRYLCQYYEIVLFTSLPLNQAEPVYRKLDPYHIIMWPLFREATRYHKGQYIKDLSYLNRDLSRVIILDTKAEHVQAQPENAIILPPWNGDPKDRDLVSYVPFLEQIAGAGVSDVRKALASFQGTHIPTEYARREAAAREAFNKQLAEERSRKPKLSLGSAFGLTAGPAPGSRVMSEDGSTLTEGFEKGLMLSDQIREQGRKTYEQTELQIRRDGEKWLKEMEEEEKKAQEEFYAKNIKGNMFGMFGAKPQPPPPTGTVTAEQQGEKRQ